MFNTSFRVNKPGHVREECSTSDRIFHVTYKQVGRKAVSKCLAAGRLGEASGLDSRLDGLLQPALVKMMPPQCIRARIFGEPIRRKDILPAPLAAGIRILAVEREREIDRAIAALKIRGVP